MAAFHIFYALFSPAWLNINQFIWHRWFGAQTLYKLCCGSLLPIHSFLAFDCHLQHPPTQRTNLFTSSHQKWKLEQVPDSSNPAYFLVLFWSLFTFAGERAEGFFCCSKPFWNTTAQQKLHVCLGFASQMEEGGNDTKGWWCEYPSPHFVLFLPGFLIEHNSKVFGTTTAWDTGTIRHFSRVFCHF